MILDTFYEQDHEIEVLVDETEEFSEMEEIEERSDLFPVRTVNGIKADAFGNVDLGIFTFWVGTQEEFNKLSVDEMYDDQIIHFIIEGE